MAVQDLPFTVGLARDDRSLQMACRVRATGYGHHLPDAATSAVHPEAFDRDRHCAVLLVQHKVTGEPLGTARLHVTTYGGAIPLEQCIELPPDVRAGAIAEMTKLAVIVGADPIVKLALWKAGYLFCLVHQVRHWFMGARSPALVRQYSRLGALPFHEDGRSVPLTYAGGIPHQVLRFDVTSAERDWHQARHPLFDFMFRTLHPDIRLSALGATHAEA
jgi:hypothetical protein